MSQYMIEPMLNKLLYWRDTVRIIVLVESVECVFYWKDASHNTLDKLLYWRYGSHNRLFTVLEGCIPLIHYRLGCISH